MCTNIIFVHRDNNINYVQLITEICYALEIKTLNIMLCSFYPHIIKHYLKMYSFGNLNTSSHLGHINIVKH